MKLDFSQLKDFAFDERKFDIHLYADYAEILCLRCLDHKVTRDIFLKRLQGEDFFSTANGRSVDMNEALPDDEPLITLDDNEDVEEGDEGDKPHEEDAFLNQRVKPIERDSRREAFINDIFEHLLSRFLVLDAKDYPFNVDDDAKTLALKDDLTSSQVLYILLLASSHLQIFSENSSELTTFFEKISFKAFKRLLPGRAEVQFFTAGNNRSEMFSGSLFKRLSELSNKLKARLDIKEEELPNTDSGDHGLDLVGWINMGDGANGSLILFGQCACGRDWKKKQHEVSAGRWDRKLGMCAKHVPVMHIPYFIRNVNADWHEPTEICSLMIDRLRFFSMAEQKDIDELITEETKKACKEALANPDLVML